MSELIKLEMKKLCRRKLTIAVTLCCFFATVLLFSLPYLQYQAWDENGTMLSRDDAVSYRHKCYNDISGILTEERITKDLQEYQELYNNPENLITQGGETSFIDEIYDGYLAPRKSYLNMLGDTYFDNEMGYLNIPQISLENGAEFYQAKDETINMRINSDSLTSAEKTYWKNKSSKIPQPYEYGYVLGWSAFGDTVQTLIVCILGICITVAPVFANEYQTGADAVVLSTRFGKTKVVYAKIISAIIFGTIVFAINAAAALLLPLLTFGADGGSLPLQIMDSTCPYALTFSQAAFILIGIAYIVMLGLLSFTLLCSSKMSSAFPVLIIDVLIIFLPTFLRFPKTNLLQHIYHLFPDQTLVGLSVFKEYFSYSLGGIVLNPFGMIILLYTVIVFATLPLAGRTFSTHQVQT